MSGMRALFVTSAVVRRFAPGPDGSLPWRRSSSAGHAEGDGPGCCPARWIVALLLAGLLSSWCAAQKQPGLAPLPPMGWNDWAHYQCDFTEQTILDNARALVRTGLAARGYRTVTIDDCWMLKARDGRGDLQPDPQRFPHGMKPVAEAIHHLGLRFGIYEDAGSETCGGFAGSGVPEGGGEDHFLQDAKLFAGWGVDYLKLDGCNVYAAKGESQNTAYRAAYRAQSAALLQVGRPVIFSESAPAYFQGTAEWYDVLSWVRSYGQLWREGSDIATFDVKTPDAPRFQSVLWNYAYNLPLGRFQSAGNWNDADFIIGGDGGMTPAETRSQVALWSMMSAPLILSSNLSALSPEAISVLGNREVVSVDQDPLGKMATLLQRTTASDLLFKELAGGRYAVAVLNRGRASLHVELRAADLGFAPVGCRFSSVDLWSGRREPDALRLQAEIAPHDTAIWRVHPAGACGAPARMGAITRLASGRHRDAEGYTLCMASNGDVEACSDSQAQRWTVTPAGALESAGRCLAAEDGRVRMQRCGSSEAQRWKYTLVGDLINRGDRLCLTGSAKQGLTLAMCGRSLAAQIWSLPND